MEILSVQNQYPERFSIITNTTKTKAWSTSLQTTTTRNNAIKSDLNITTTTAAAAAPVATVTGTTTTTAAAAASAAAATTNATTSVNNTNRNFLPDKELLYCDKIELAAINDLGSRLLAELRAAKSRNLTCTEVSIPCDLITRIASEIIRVSEREPCGVRGCTLYIEFEDEPQNSRRIGTLKVDHEMVSTFELYLTLRQDKRGWASLLPQFMKHLSRTITISPEFSLTKHKLYSPSESS